ncbi:MAG TPA: trypsin-like peptidase domain-containing protein [Anaeromyxobacteraceae bacterium]|nr:trypsin-like peptidase domain-containing protein [Anaeromyxobacteraceae bacterium]
MDPGSDDRRRAKWSAAVLAFLLGAAVALLAVKVFRPVPAGRVAPAAEPDAGPVAAAPVAQPVVARGDLAEDEKATIELFKRSSPSVVYITTLARQVVGFFDVEEVPQGTGSGFLWDRAGHVVTNFHVIQGASAARVTLHDQSVWPATLVGVAPDQDLAVLRIRAPGEKLAPVLVGTSRDLQVGQKVFAIGNPFGLDHTLTTGIVSALGRIIPAMTGRRIEGVIQTDAAINPGNSGGPLLDSAGRLVGVNTLIASPSGASAGIGFAVPVDTVSRVIPELVAHGRVVRPRLGIAAGSEWVLRRIGVEGVLVVSVAKGSAAARAGLRGTTRTEDGAIVLGDVIQGLDQRKVASPDDLFAALEEHKPGDTVTLRLLRGERTVEVKVRLDAPE